MRKLLIFACFAFLPLMANTASVTMLNPQVQATLNNNTKALALKDEVPMSSTIKSFENGSAQLMLSDSSLISIASNSEISLLDYADEDEKESIVVGMAKGTARFVTGEISRKNKEAFVVETPNATIGIRGTVISVTCDADFTSVYLSQTSGAGVIITNKQTGEKIELLKPGNIVNVTNQGSTQKEANIAEARAMVGAFRPALSALEMSIDRLEIVQALDDAPKATELTANEATNEGERKIAAQEAAVLAAQQAAQQAAARAELEARPTSSGGGSGGGDSPRPTPSPDPRPTPTPQPDPQPTGLDVTQIEGNFKGITDNPDDVINFSVGLGDAAIKDASFSVFGADGTSSMEVMVAVR